MKFKLIGLLIFTLLLSGCNFWPNITSEKFDASLVLESNSAPDTTAEVEFQYSAPWDTGVFDAYFAGARIAPEIGGIKGGIVPHHLLAGYIPATFFKSLEKQKPSLIVLFGPNHYNAGGAKAISTLRDWKTPYGIVKTDRDLVGLLAQRGIIKVREDVIREEHSIYSLVPFIAKSIPDTKILPIIFSYKTDVGKLNEVLANLIPQLPEDAVIVSSIDFSHYQTLPSSIFHDELSKSAIKNFDFGRLEKLEIDSAPSLYMLLRIMENRRAQKIAYEISDNSAVILRNPSIKEGTSYYSPYFVNGEKEKIRIASILNFGDMMLDRSVKKVIDANSPEYIFSKLAGQEERFFLGMDAVSANLEGPFANYRRETSKSIAFQFDPKLIPTLKKYNFSILSLANNHSQDMSAEGFNESKTNLANAGISFYGAQYSIDENSLLFKRVGDYNFTFIGLNDTNSPVSLTKVKKLVDEAKPKSDFILVNIHWGAEYKDVSNTNQRNLAHTLIDMGVDVIIGHHPHVIQEMEIYKNRPVFYSLGNFVFDQYFSAETQQGLGVGLIFKDGEISTTVFPLESKKSQVSQMEYAKSVKFFADWTKGSRLGNNKFINFKTTIRI